MNRVAAWLEKYIYSPLFIPAYELNECQLNARNAILKNINENVYKYQRVPCPNCKAFSAIEIAARDTYSIPSVFSICDVCGLIYTSTRLSDQSLNKLYEHDYRLLDRGRNKPSFSFYRFQNQKGVQIKNFYEERLGKMPLDTLVIEVGAGAGGILGYFHSQGYEVLGVDLDPSYIGLGKKILGDRLTLGKVDSILEKISIMRKDRPIFLIYEQVMEHLQDPLEELRNIRNLINPDYLYISVPGIRNIEKQYKGGLQRYLQFVHLIHFELNTLSLMLGKAGYKLISGNEEVRALYKLDVELDGLSQNIPTDVKITQNFIESLPSRNYGVGKVFVFHGKLFLKKIIRCLGLKKGIRIVFWIIFRAVLYRQFHSPGKSKDRILLEGTILREIYFGPYENVAFIGIHPQSSWYGYISLLRKNLQFDYVDPCAQIEPKCGAFHRCTLQDLRKDINFYGRYDCVIMNGVFGYGVDSPEEKREAIDAIDKILDIDGILIVGFRDGKTICDIDISLVPDNFFPCNILGTLKHKLENLHSNGHSYVAFRKVSN